ncbi:MAG: hypothetical protein ACK56I_19240, partial [bacterium]
MVPCTWSCAAVMGARESASSTLPVTLRPWAARGLARSARAARSRPARARAPYMERPQGGGMVSHRRSGLADRTNVRPTHIPR